MTSQAKKIQQMLARGDFKMSFHAEQRAIERFVLESDIMQCGRTVSRIKSQDDMRTWKVTGKDLDGEKLTVVCKLRAGLLIVTVY